MITAQAHSNPQIVAFLENIQTEWQAQGLAFGWHTERFSPGRRDGAYGDGAVMVFQHVLTGRGQTQMDHA
eukprot:11886826-Prorocentrum_lima.AAC.1